MDSRAEITQLGFVVKCKAESAVWTLQALI
nr:MAG TPA: hypothetical protein [Caudoviricetes sp.]